MLKVAVVGCGYWGKNLVRNFYELGSLDTVCDVSQDMLNLMKERHPKIKTTTDFNEILSSDEIKAVAIASPAATHYDLAKKAILADKDVFVEKPLAINTKQAKELVKLAKEKDKILMVGHILQYHPAVIRLKEMIKAGDICSFGCPQKSLTVG